MVRTLSRPAGAARRQGNGTAASNPPADNVVPGVLMLPRKIAIAVAVAGLSTGALAANAVGSSGPSEATFGAPAGGFAAYHGTTMKTDAKKAPSNAKVAYSGRKLVLAQSYIGR